MIYFGVFGVAGAPYVYTAMNYLSVGCAVRTISITHFQTIMLNKKILPIIFFLVFPALAWGQSTRQLVEQGNTAYKNGKFAKALEAYQQAARKEPKSPYVQFDLGNALYKTGDLQGALSAYEKAAANSRDAKFIGKSRFNEGNAAFNEAQAKLKTDSETALQGMTDSLRYYREAMNLDPQLVNAARNIEIVKNKIHKVKQKMAKQQAKQQAARAAKKKMAKELKDMAKKQQEMAAKNQNKAAKKKENKKQKSGKDSKNVTDNKSGSDLAAQQKLRQQTADMAKKMAKEQKKQGTKDLAKAKDALDSAIAQQDKSIDDLKKQTPAKAAKAQAEAAKKLKQAAESLKEPEKKKDDKAKKDKKGKDGKAGQNKGKKGKKQDAAAKPSKPAKKGKKSEKSPENANKAKKNGQSGKETAADLLNEERQNNIRRQQEQNQSRSGYDAVDKNW